jgi:tetratricopeptide (TPR) repeat protein
MKTILAALIGLTLVTPAAALGQVADDAARGKALAHFRAGQELMLAEQFEKAEMEFGRAVDLDPMLTLAHYGLGQSRMAQKKYPGAVRAFTACREAYRQIYMLQQSDAAVMDRRVQFEVRELQDSINLLRSGRVKSFGGVASTADTKIAQLETRIRDLERMRQRGGGAFQPPAEVLLSLGSAHFRNGELPAAEEEWKAATAVNNRLGEAHNNLAALYAMGRRKKEATDEVRAAERAGFRVNPQLKSDIERLPN